MKSYVLMILLFLGCLGAHAQTESKILVSLNKTNLEDLTEFNGWTQFDDSQKDFSIAVEPEGLAITNPRVQAQAWQPQVMVVPDGSFDLEEGHNYIVRLTVKVPSDGTYQLNIGSWTSDDVSRVSVKANDEFQIIDVEFPEYKDNVAGAHVLLQLGWVKGTTILKEIEVFEKTGYWHNGEFQELIRDESSLYNFVQPWNEKSQKALNDLLAGKRITDDQSIIRFNENEYYVHKGHPLPEGDYYVSDLYKLNIPNREEKTVCIMPRIAMFIKDGFLIDDILERLGNKVTIESGPFDSPDDNNEYYLACQMNTSEEILEALLDINVLYKSGNYGISWYYPHCLYILPNTLPDAYTYKDKEDGMKLIFEKDWSGVEYGVIDGEDDNLWEGTDEGLAITNPRMQENIGAIWTIIAWDFSLELGHDYIVRLTMKVPSDGMYQVVLYGDGFTNNSLCQVPVTAGDDFQVIDVEFPDFGVDFWSDGHIFFQSGWVVGTTVLKKVEILEKVSGNTVAIKTAKVSKADDTIYNLAGQRVGPSYKGIVVSKGRKMVK